MASVFKLKLLDRYIHEVDMSDALKAQAQQMHKEFMEIKEDLGSYAAYHIFGRSDTAIFEKMYEQTSYWYLALCARVPRDKVAPIAFCFEKFSLDTVKTYVKAFDFGSTSEKFEKIYAQDSFVYTNIQLMIGAVRSTSGHSKLEAEFEEDLMSPKGKDIPTRIEHEATQYARYNSKIGPMIETNDCVVRKYQEDPADLYSQYISFEESEKTIEVLINIKSPFRVGYCARHKTPGFLTLKPVSVSKETLLDKRMSVQEFKKHWQSLFEVMLGIKNDGLDRDAQIPMSPLIFGD